MLEKAKMTGKELFPNLEVISCWADGNSEPYAKKLQKLFPDVYIQPKGLLATEGIMTIPIEGLGKRLTNSHFFEFVDKNGDIRLKSQLDIGDEYEIILTTRDTLRAVDFNHSRRARSARIRSRTCDLRRNRRADST